MSEFKIKVNVELDADGLKSQLDKLSGEVELKLNTNKIEEQLKGLKKSFKDTFKLDGQVINDLNKIAKVLNNFNKQLVGGKNPSNSSVSQAVKDYKDLYNTVTKLQKQMSKGGLGEEGLRRTQDQINSITNLMNKLRNEMSDSENASLDLFEGKKSLDSLNDLNQALIKIENQSDNLRKQISSIDMSTLSDDSQSELLKTLDTIRRIKNEIKEDITLEIETGRAFDDLARASETIKRIQKESTDSIRKANEESNQQIKKQKSEMDALVTEYKNIGNTVSQLQNQLNKGGLGEDSVERTKSQITDLISQMQKLKSQMDDYGKTKANAFDKKLEDKSFVNLSNALSKIESNAVNLSTKLNSISFDHIDASKIEKIRNELDEIRKTAKNVDIVFDTDGINHILSNLQKISTEIENLGKVESLSKIFDSVKGDIQKAGGDVEEFVNTLKELESIAKNVDGSFDKAFSNASSSLKQMNGVAKNVNSEIKGLRKIVDDFKGNFAQFTLGEIAGDFIADGIRTMATGFKETIVETDSAIVALNKVYKENLNGKNLKAYLEQVTEVAKGTGQTSVDIINGTTKAIQSGIKDIDDAMEFARQSAIFANVGDVDQGQADTMITSIMSAYGGMENALKPVREQVKGMGQDYNTLTKFMDLAKTSLVVE